MNKRNILLIIIVIILTISLTIVSLRLYKITKDKTSKNTTYYGQRGNISNTEKVEFLTKNEDFLVGMIELDFSEKEKEFTKDQMTTFAVYVAKKRYSDLLENYVGNNKKDSYKIDIEIIDAIIKEFFNVNDISYSDEDNKYYSQSRKCFLFNEKFEKSMWYYPVNEESIESEKTKEKYKVITADSIYIDENKEDQNYKSAKYNGEYTENMVEYTIKFKFDEKGYLKSYQYVKK